MKKTLLTLMLALAMMLPLLGLAETAATPEAEAPVEETVAPLGQQYSRRWNNPGTNLPVPAAGKRFTDEDNNGVCDLCGNEPGKNTLAPGYVDEDNDGVCDHHGTDEQYQGRQGNRPMGRQGMQRPGMRRPGMQGPGMQAPGRRMHRMNPGQGVTPPAFNNRNFGPGRR